MAIRRSICRYNILPGLQPFIKTRFVPTQKSSQQNSVPKRWWSTSHRRPGPAHVPNMQQPIGKITLRRRKRSTIDCCRIRTSLKTKMPGQRRAFAFHYEGELIRLQVVFEDIVIGRRRRSDTWFLFFFVDEHEGDGCESQQRKIFKKLHTVSPSKGMNSSQLF